MKDYLTDDEIRNSLVIIWKLPLDAGSCPEEIHEKLNKYNCDTINRKRIARGIYRNEDHFVIASCYRADPQKPHIFFRGDEINTFQDILPKEIGSDCAFECLIVTTGFVQKCKHTDNAINALLAFESNNDYVITARKEVQKIVGNIPRLTQFHENEMVVAAE